MMYSYNSIWQIDADCENQAAELVNKIASMSVEQLMRIDATPAAPLLRTNKQGIATLSINGPLMPAPHNVMKMMGGTSTSELKKSLERAGNDKKIKAIIMPVNTPGGDNSMIDETSKLINDLSKVKPIYAHTTGTNASAGYYLSSNANKVFAQNRTDKIGSIGTRFVLKDTSGASEKTGVKQIVIDTGPNKSIGFGGEVTQEQKDYVGNIVNKLQGYFEESVLRGRPQIMMNKVNDGSVFMAEEAVSLGLIDRIQPIKQTYAQLVSRTL